MLRTYKGAFWPGVRKVASADLQKKLGYDAEIARWFPTHLVTVRLQDEQMYVHEATEHEWRQMGAAWDRDNANGASVAPQPRVIH